jgi:hypothetical protein
MCLFVIGGQHSTGVELISLDPKNNPVPDRLKNLNQFPTGICHGGGGMLTQG